MGEIDASRRITAIHGDSVFQFHKSDQTAGIGSALYFAHVIVGRHRRHCLLLCQDMTDQTAGTIFCFHISVVVGTGQCHVSFRISDQTAAIICHTADGNRYNGHLAVVGTVLDHYVFPVSYDSSGRTVPGGISADGDIHAAVAVGKINISFCMGRDSSGKSCTVITVNGSGYRQVPDHLRFGSSHISEKTCHPS